MAHHMGPKKVTQKITRKNSPVKGMGTRTLDLSWAFSFPSLLRGKITPRKDERYLFAFWNPQLSSTFSNMAHHMGPKKVTHKKCRKISPVKGMGTRTLVFPGRYFYSTVK
jgi:hypothetical protein